MQGTEATPRLISAFCETATRFPDKVALITEQSQFSFHDLEKIARSCEAALFPRGMAPGATLVLTTERPEFVVAFSLLASRRALRLIFAAARQVHEAGLAYDLAVGTEHSPLLAPEKQALIGPDWFAGPTASDAGFAQAAGAGAQFVVVTSGSTGVPKFVLCPEAAQMRNMLGLDFYRAFPPGPDTRMLMTFSVTMLWGLVVAFRVLLAGGSVVALTEHRNRPLQYIDLTRVSHLETTPVVIRQMLEVPQVEQYLGALRSVVVGGAFASTELLARFAGLTPAAIDVAYGTSEFGGLSLARFDPASPQAEGYLGEVFRSDVEIAFFDEALRPLPGASEGAVGFRNLRGDAPSSYLGANAAPAGAAAAKAGFVGAYFFPGDVMRRVGNHLYLIGRIKNIINVGGNKIALEAVEAALESALAVDALACLACPDADGLEALLLVYAAPEALPAEAVQAVLNDSFPGLHLARLERRASLPATAAGKRDREALRRDYL